MISKKDNNQLEAAQKQEEQDVQHKLEELNEVELEAIAGGGLLGGLPLVGGLLSSLPLVGGLL